MENIVIARNISKTYRNSEVLTTALKNVSFEIQSGSLVSFVGPSGSGKTTLLNLIGCLDTPTAGELLVVNKNISTLNFTERAKILENETDIFTPHTGSGFNWVVSIFSVISYDGAGW